MRFIDLERFNATALESDPFEHLVVSGFLRAPARAALDADFPAIARPGSFPASTLRYGASFGALLEELQSAELTRAMAAKFAVDLDGRPTMVTVRGRCQARDGRIHTDTASKIITVLIYMNPGWAATGGRLRLLRGPDDLEDFAVEVAPDWGTLLAFRRSERSFHGHQPFVGERRALQLNWVSSQAVVERELSRHRLSARLKHLAVWQR